MAEQVLNQFRSDKTLREDCVAIYEALGMDLNTAFRMFMERTRMVRGLPFPAVLPETRMTRAEAQKVIDVTREEAADFPEMSQNEINAEICSARTERRAGAVEDVQKSKKRVDIETAIESLIGAIPDTGLSLKDYREERLKKYEVTD